MEVIGVSIVLLFALITLVLMIRHSIRTYNFVVEQNKVAPCSFLINIKLFIREYLGLKTPVN